MNKKQYFLIGLIAIFASFTEVAIAQEEAVNEALALVNIPEPSFSSSTLPVLDEKGYLDLGLEQLYEYDSLGYVVRDGNKIHINHYAGSNDISVLMLHGVLSSAYTYNKTAIE